MPIAGDDMEVEVREAIHVIVARLIPSAQKAFVAAIAAPEIALIFQAEATMMIDALGLANSDGNGS
jgi:hypothetical protein